jgi:hypothetical protein
LELLGPNALCSKLRLEEAEPDCWLFLIIGAQLDLGCCPCGKLTNLVGHGEALCEDRCPPGDKVQVIPAGWEGLVSHSEKRVNKKKEKNEGKLRLTVL